MEYTPIGKVLSMTHRAHHTLVEEHLRRLDIGVGSGQFFLLLALYRRDGLCQHQLAEQYNLDKAAVARGIKKLEKLDFVSKQHSSDDQRKSLIFLTGRAHVYKKRFYAVIEGIEERICSHLSEAEIDQFLRIAENLYRGISTEIAAVRSRSSADEGGGASGAKGTPEADDSSGTTGIKDPLQQEPKNGHT